VDNPSEEFEKFEKDLEETREFMRKAVMDSLNKNSKDWSAAASWAGFNLENATEDSESPENETPSFEELVIIELGKLQWINMQILNELRKRK